MARLPRLAVAGHLHHVAQWGHNRTEIVADERDRQALMAILDAAAKRFGVTVHAWALLPERFHLLATPATDDAMANMMQAVGRDYVRYFNKRHGRTGTLWAGRFRSSVLEASTLGLACMVFIDLLAVRSGWAGMAPEHAWSSHAHYAGLGAAVQPVAVSPLSEVWQLGNTPFAREAAYREQVERAHGAEQFASLEQALQGGWALGSPEFVAGMQRVAQRRVTKARPGRPSKSGPGRPAQALTTGKSKPV